MSAALLHYSHPALPPVGVWWLPGQRTQPQSYYPNPNDPLFIDGARAVLGGNYTGELLTLAQWQSVAQRLARTANPYVQFAAVDPGDASPQSLLTVAPQELKPIELS